jgi:TetR/AcrR family transcriptional regulator, transcriptional repressor for nem operon
MGKPKRYDDDEVIDKAIELFRDKSYAAVSVDELLAVMGIGKGSFYLNFKGGKQDLYERSFKRYAERMNEKLKREIEGAENAVVYLKDQFMLMADSLDRNKDRGCYYGNALVSLSQDEKDIKAVAEKYLKDLQQIFVKGIRDSKEKGFIAKDKNSEILAWYLINLWNGIQVTRRIEKSPALLSQLVEFAFKAFD